MKDLTQQALAVILLAIGLFLISLPGASSIDQNLLENGDFEEWEIRTVIYQTACGICSPVSFLQTDTVLMPEDWLVDLVHSCCIFSELENAVSQGEPNTGSFGLQEGGFSGASVATGISLFQDVDVEPGHPFVPSYFAKNSVPGFPATARRMRGTWFGENGNPIGAAFFLAPPASSTYVLVQGSTIFAPCNTEFLRVFLDKADFGGILYDDVSVVEDETAEPIDCPDE